MPFREAHHVAGGLGKLAESRGENLSGLSLDDLKAAHPAFTEDALGWLDPETAAERRTSLGGTAWSEVERQIRVLRAKL